MSALTAAAASSSPEPTPASLASPPKLPTISVSYAHTGETMRSNDMGMRPMQQRVWAKRGEQYLLIKSPPASGKSRALKYVALDKLHKQGLKQVIVTVPERTIGASFADEKLSEQHFWEDWVVVPKWNLCNAPDTEDGRAKVDAVDAFLKSEDRILVCAHATFRNAVERYGVAAFDERLIAVDEFHHVSVNPNNRLGQWLRDLIARDKAHMVAMTGSYFRGDTAAVLHPEDEARFCPVTYTYYEQLNGYEHLKQLEIGYYFYTGRYLDDIAAVLDPAEKTIVHIPHVAAGASTGDKQGEVAAIMGLLGHWEGTDLQTGFHLVRTPDTPERPGRVLRIADLVEDDPATRDRVIAALRAPDKKHLREHVDLIIALGMAKEGFDWIWCEHALTVGYRSSLTEIVQIIGRTTRDAVGKTRVRFTNLIPALDATQVEVNVAVNDTLKAIGASLLMEQVIAPRFDFKPVTPPTGTGGSTGESGPSVLPPDGPKPIQPDSETGGVEVIIKGLVEPKSEAAKRICKEDLNEIAAAFLQNPEVLLRGLFDENLIPPLLNIGVMGRIVRERYPDLDEGDHEAVREHAVARAVLISEINKAAAAETDKVTGQGGGGVTSGTEEPPAPNRTFIDMANTYALNVGELSVDMIDQINPFSHAYAILSKALDAQRLQELHAVITARHRKISPQEAESLAQVAKAFKEKRGRIPSESSSDPWEREVARGAAAFMRYDAAGAYDEEEESAGGEIEPL